MILIVFSDFFDMSNTTADGFYDQGVQILVNMCGAPPHERQCTALLWVASGTRPAPTRTWPGRSALCNHR